jgi:hypothetical protein
VQLPAWVAAGDLLEEGQELLVAMARGALADDVPGRDLQRGEQGRGPVADVVVGALIGPVGPDPADRLGALQGLDLGLFVHAQHHRPLGWVQVQADDVVDFGHQLRVGGELEGLGPPRLDAVLAPDAGDGVAAHTELAGQQPGGPVGNPQPWWWRVEGDRQDLGPVGSTDGLWSSRPGPVGQSAQPAADVAAAASNDRRSRDADPLGDLGVGDSLGGQEQDASPLPEHSRQPAGPGPSAQLGQVFRGDGKRGSGRHAAYSHDPPHRQTTSATQH